MRILHLTTFLLPSTETFIRDQLDTPGVEHHIGGVERMAGLSLEGIDASAAFDGKTSRRPGWSLARLPAIRRFTNELIDRVRPDAILIHFGFSAQFFAGIAAARTVPYFIFLYGEDVMNDRWSRLLNPFWLSNVLTAPRAGRQAVKVFALSRYLTGMAEKAGYPAGKLVVHHLGVPLPSAERAGWERRRRNVLFVGRLVHKKGPDNLIRAFKTLAQHGSKLTLDIVGDGPMRPQLAAMAAGVPAIRLHGALPRHEVQRMMSEALCFCMPSRKEGLGMVYLEAQAAGTPAIGHGVTGSAEAIVDGATGFHFHDPEARDLPAILAKVEAMPAADWERMSVAAAQRIAADFEVEKRNRLLFETISAAIRHDQDGRRTWWKRMVALHPIYA